MELRTINASSSQCSQFSTNMQGVIHFLLEKKTEQIFYSRTGVG